MAKPIVSTSFASLLASSRDDAARSRRKVQNLKDAKADIQAALASFTKIVKTVRLHDKRVQADAWASVSSYEVIAPVLLCAYITIPKAKSLDNLAFKYASGAAKMAGFEFPREVIKQATDYSAGLRWEGIRRVGNIRVELTLRLELDVEDAGATCQRVQVGVKTEEVPVYELRCD